MACEIEQVVPHQFCLDFVLMIISFANLKKGELPVSEKYSSFLTRCHIFISVGLVSFNKKHSSFRL